MAYIKEKKIEKKELERADEKIRISKAERIDKISPEVCNMFVIEYEEVCLDV